MKVAVILCCVAWSIYAVKGEIEADGPEIAEKRSKGTVQVEGCNDAESRVAACENGGICKKLDWGEGLRNHYICKCTRRYYGHTCNRRSVPNVG